MAVASAIECGQLNARISFVFCSREPAEAPETDLFFELVRSYGVPYEYLSYRRFRTDHCASRPSVAEKLPGWRLDYDREAMRLLEKYSVDICVLAGYMLVVGPEMCQKYAMLNLHPAEPGGPVGTWRDVIWKLIETRAARSGVMMHLAIPELDKGPVVTYCNFPVVGGKFDRLWREVTTTTAMELKKTQGESLGLFQLIRQHGAARELPLIVSTLRAFSEGRVRIVNGRAVDSKGEEIAGYDLSREVDAAVKGVT